MSRQPTRRCGILSQISTLGGKIWKIGISNSMTYRPPNSRKSKFATEPFDGLMPYRSAATTVDNCNALFFTRNLAPNSIALAPAHGEAENMRILLGG
jgi:hypothetical protein